jgi:cell division protease FtsH
MKLFLVLWVSCLSLGHSFRSFPARKLLHAYAKVSAYADPGPEPLPPPQKYPISQNHYEQYLKRLNSRNETIRDEAILNQESNGFSNNFNDTDGNNENQRPRGGFPGGGLQIIIGPQGIRGLQNPGDMDFNPFMQGNQQDGDDDPDTFANFKRRQGKKSDNFEVITDFPVSFKDVGGYDLVKQELDQCIDILSNYEKYTQYNVRIPKGLIFEGPPGNGKTLLAKALAGEAKIPFISVSGAQFQEKYVGVGAARIRELFQLASQYKPIIVFIDEIDALGRTRSGDGESSSSERDNTLNELLVAMDGFKNSSGIFIIGATNRADLLDPALLRPGRVDKRVFIGNPDAKTREEIVRIHIKGKPYQACLSIADIVEMTNGLSGAQIENLLNEAMLNALRHNREIFTNEDVDFIMNKMMVGWQPNEHKFTSDIIDHIAIHELGHAVVGLLSKHHSKMTKVIINLQAPKSPAYTVFEASDSPLYTRESLFEHLMILLGGRIAEEVFYNASVTTGAINDFEEALKLAEKMVIYYGMGSNVIYPKNSEKYNAIIDDEVVNLIKQAYSASEHIIREAKSFVFEGAELLKKENIIQADALNEILHSKYKHLLMKN